MSAEAEAAEFDPNLKKKKKKKKKKESDEAEPAVDEASAAPVEEDTPAEPAEGELPEKKKKKKKKPVLDGGDDDDDDSFGTFDASKKKKKKPKKLEDVDEDTNMSKASESVQDGGDGDVDGVTDGMEAMTTEQEKEKKPVKEMPVWQKEDRVMTYEELLQRIFGLLNPNISDKKAFKMKPPVVVREGTKRVVLVNFQEITTSMNRSPEHLLSFMLAELGTSGSADAMGRVTFKYAGRQAQKHMESVIKQYVKEYVLCKLCKSPDTKLNKDSATRLYFMVCGSCGASRSVNPIKSGFQAQIGKRKKK